jgi:hypothetical protein
MMRKSRGDREAFQKAPRVSSEVTLWSVGVFTRCC